MKFRRLASDQGEGTLQVWRRLKNLSTQNDRPLVVSVWDQVSYNPLPKAVTRCCWGSETKLKYHNVDVAITYRVHDFENFDENFVQGTISPLLKSHIPLDGSVSLFKYLPTELKRI